MELNETSTVNFIKGFQLLVINNQKEFGNKRKTGFHKYRETI